MMHVIIENMDF